MAHPAFIHPSWTGANYVPPAPYCGLSSLETALGVVLHDLDVATRAAKACPYPIRKAQHEASAAERQAIADAIRAELAAQAQREAA